MWVCFNLCIALALRGMLYWIIRSSRYSSIQQHTEWVKEISCTCPRLKYKHNAWKHAASTLSIYERCYLHKIISFSYIYLFLIWFWFSQLFILIVYLGYASSSFLFWRNFGFWVKICGYCMYLTRTFKYKCIICK